MQDACADALLRILRNSPVILRNSKAGYQHSSLLLQVAQFYCNALWRHSIPGLSSFLLEHKQAHSDSVSAV
jgi:hypothetical protein